MNSEQAKKIADDVFARFKKVDKTFVAADGQAFFDEMHAKSHAVNNRSEKELKVFTFLRDVAKAGDGKETSKGDKT